jgi:hypothetical protein
MKTAIALGLLILTAGIGHAGEASGVIQDVHMGPLYGSRIFIKISGTFAQPQPGHCQNNEFHFAFDADGTGGKATLATVLAAKASQSTVRISGFNQCTVWSSVEDLRTISFLN